MKNINAPTTESCSGCGVCAAVCPREAISLTLDDAGFYTARVRAAACVNCGLCRKVCHRFSPVNPGVSLYDVPLFAMQSADTGTVRRCSSGGIAHELAVQAIAAGGQAVGAVYDLSTNTVRHEIVAEEDHISRLDGSKYLQSRPDTAFREVLRIARDRHCTVFGTPCQIANLSRAADTLGLRDRLLLVEIFCHGVPSYRLWEAQLETVRRKLGSGCFDDVQFRHKKDDWHSYCLKIERNDKTYYGKRETALLYQVFFENVLLGDACQTCTARKEHSLADLRLGDYWGQRFSHRSDGVSAVFVCTPRGMTALDQLRRSGAITKLTASDAAEMLAAQNMEGYHNPQLHDEAMAVLRTEGLRSAVRYYRRRQSPRQKLKRLLLHASTILPDPLRAKLRKKNSSRLLHNQEKAE